MSHIHIPLGEEGLLYHRIGILINASKIPANFPIFDHIGYLSTLVCDSI